MSPEQEPTIPQNQNSQSPEQITQNILGFVAEQNSGVVSSEQLQAMAVLVGPTALANCVVGLRASNVAEIEFNEELQISQVRLLEQAGHTAVSALGTEPEESPEGSTESEADHQEDSPGGTQSTGEPAIEDLSEVELAGVSARVAIVNYLSSRLDLTLEKGDARSAGSLLAEKLSPFGHTTAAISQALRILAEEGIVDLEKPTEKAKIIQSIKLDETAKKNS